MLVKDLKKFVLSFNKPKSLISGANFYSKAVKHITNKNKNIPSNLSNSVDKILYGTK